MSQEQRGRHEQLAREAAGQAAGEYLTSINKYDLSSLTAHEWATFTDTLFNTRVDELRRLLMTNEAPF